MGLFLDLLYLAAGAAFFPFYYRRLKRTGRDTSQIWKRLKAPPRLDPAYYRVLIHAVSVGEVQAAVPLVRELENVLPPEVDIALSVSTTTGKEQAERLLPEVASFYMPPDLSFLVKRMLRRTAPSVLVLMELELWPNLVRYAEKAGVPVVVVNGRLSERSFRGYRRLGRLFRRTLDRVRLFGMQNAEYARRLVDLGVPEEKIVVLGNVKYDRALSLGDSAKVSYLRNIYGVGEDSLVLTAGSTHPGEEEAVVDVFRRLKRDFPSLRLFLAPRHPGRVGEILPLLEGMDFRLRSELGKAAAKPRDAVVVDVIGELAYLYRLSDAAFVGGSLVEHGGQNPLEPAAAGVPVVFGPHMFNFEQEAALLLEAGGAERVDSGRGLEDVLRRWLSSPGERASIGRRAREAIEPSRGASARYAEVVRKYLSETMS